MVYWKSIFRSGLCLSNLGGLALIIGFDWNIRRDIKCLFFRFYFQLHFFNILIFFSRDLRHVNEVRINISINLFFLSRNIFIIIWIYFVYRQKNNVNSNKQSERKIKSLKFKQKSSNLNKKLNLFNFQGFFFEFS